MAFTPETICDSDIIIEYQNPILVPYKYALVPFNASVDNSDFKKLYLELKNISCRLIVNPNSTPYFALDTSDQFKNAIKKIEHTANLHLYNLAQQGSAPPPILCSFSYGAIHFIKPTIRGSSSYFKPAWNIEGLNKVKESVNYHNIQLTLEIGNIILNQYDNEYPASLFIRVSKIEPCKYHIK